MITRVLEAAIGGHQYTCFERPYVREAEINPGAD
jgi:hypothetical protein